MEHPLVIGCLLLGCTLPVLAGTSTTSTTSIHKCSLEGGRVMYQDEPCPEGHELRDFDRDPAEVSVVPFVAAKPEPAPQRSRENARDKHASSGGNARAVQKSAGASGDASQRKFLAPGIGVGEVLARIGKPDVRSGGKGGKSERWTYLPTASDPSTITTLTFDAGRLVQVERKILR